jgi:PHD/YefM family antitoxin component YafN of YafNO toxin-antitoxin module
MVANNERYVVDEHGNRQSVLLSIEDYQHLLEELEELESIRAYDAAKASGDEAIPFEQAVAEVEQERQ